CHHNHAAAADKLIDYRSSDTTDPTKWKQANLCYACHSASSTETSVAVGYTKPFAWNGRDVKAQFQRVSHHPTVARVGDPSVEPGIWTQTTQTEFGLDTLTNTTAVSGGSGTSGAVQLSPYTQLWSDDFQDGDISDWATTGDVSATQSWSSPNWSIQLGDGSTATDIAQSPVFSLAGRTNVKLSFDYQRVGLDSGQTEWMYIDYSTNGGTSYSATPLWSIEGNGGTDSATITGVSLPAGTNRIRLRVTNADSGEYGRWDNLAITADPAYINSGNVVSTPIPSGVGSVSTWTTVSYTVSQPVGSAIAVDVLDASNGSVLLSGVSSGTSLSGLTASSIKLRARMTGNAPAARVVSDDFNDDSFDTAKWGNQYIGSTDPDSAHSETLKSITFATALIDPTTGMDSRSPDNDGTGWYRNTGTGSDGTGGYGRTGATDYDLDRFMYKNFGDLSALASVDVSFYWRNGNSNMTTGDYLYVEWSKDGGSTWSAVDSVTSTAADSSWGALSGTGLPVGSNCELRVRAKVQDASNDSWYVDTITVTGNYAAGNAWPSETGGQLTLRAEGTDFTGTADEGEFTYIKPTAADWVDTQDFDMIVRVPSYNNPGADGWMKAGLMVRTGTTEANAYAANAAMIGLYVTDTNGVVFQYRTTAGGTASANTAGTDDAPVYLKLSRRGNVFTGYKSTDGATWTQVGSQSVTMSTYVLPGICLTSNINDTFSDATFDDFSITEDTGASSVTPRLDDWTVTYQWVPAPTVGSLTCVNCHNVHYAGRGTAGTVWQMVRAALPSNTKQTYAGTPTQFCLECHDGSAPTQAITNETTIVPYAVEFSNQSGKPFFPGWNKSAADTEWSASSHGNSTVPNMTPECGTCHDPHASDNKRLTALTAFYSGGSAPGSHVDERRNNSTTYSEQNLCYACHTSDRTPNCTGGACHQSPVDALNVQTAFGSTYRHPVEVNGRHSDTETASGLGASNRHAECADCHDPHAARSGLHTAAGIKTSKPGEVLRGAIGVKVSVWPSNWTTVAAGNWTTERMTGESTDYEAYVCLKCHSGYSGQPFTVTRSDATTYTSTDLALEFNPGNFSEHNVLGQSKGMETLFTVDGTQYTWNKPADSTFLVSGLTSNSPMTCTDCHSNTTAAAKGPHGSSTQWIIDPNYPTDWKTTYLSGSNMSNTTNICAKCHTNLTSANDVHGQGDHQGSGDGNCTTCHIKIPHGWKRPRLLGYTSDPVNYRSGHPSGGGLNGVALHDETYSGWDTPDCATSGGCEHGSHEYTGPSW
ncbi:MAG: hypothetical protein LLG24_01565, partial [Actinomycetia bacterium]|nr:hypothetical protein [Actinomycetes bacterium]